MTIRAKLSLLSSALVLTILGLSGVLQQVFERRTLLAAQADHRADTVRQLVRVCEDAVQDRPSNPQTSHLMSMFEIDPIATSPLLVNYVKTLLSFEPVSYVILLDRSGATRFHSDFLKGDASAIMADRSADPATAFALAAKDAAWRRGTENGVGVIEYAAAVNNQGKPAAAIRVGFDEGKAAAAISAALAESRRRFLFVALLCLVVGVAGAGLLANHFNEPLQRLVEGARRIGEGDLKHRIPAERSDEFGRLSGAFNEMAVRLAELDALKESIFQTITHDLLNPLMSISGYLQVVSMSLEGPDSEKQIKRLNLALKATKQLDSMVTDILDIAKMEAGSMTLSLKPLSLQTLIGEVVELMSVQAAGYKVKLAAEVPDGFPEIRADGDLLRRVVTNLAGNSLKFTPEGGSVTIRAETESGGTRVSVVDTGCGIPKDKMKHMFSKFFQVSESQELARKRGTGLGLTVCKQVVEAHGGRIWVESEWGKGSSFIFTLPAGATVAEASH